MSVINKKKAKKKKHPIQQQQQQQQKITRVREIIFSLGINNSKKNELNFSSR